MEGNHCEEDNVVCLSATTTGGTTVPGMTANTLTVAKSGTNLNFAWAAPGGTCAPTQYKLYRGTLPWTAYTHLGWACTITGLTYSGIQDTGSYYYLLVPRTATQEGSYGTDFPGLVQRPIGTPQCSGVTQNLTAC